MDERQLEMAERLEAAQRDCAVAKATRAAQPEKHPDFDGKHCVGCESEILSGRLAMGRVRCVGCQEIIEKQRGRR